VCVTKFNRVLILRALRRSRIRSFTARLWLEAPPRNCKGALPGPPHRKPPETVTGCWGLPPSPSTKPYDSRNAVCPTNQGPSRGGGGSKKSRISCFVPGGSGPGFGICTRRARVRDLRAESFRNQVTDRLINAPPRVGGRRGEEGEVSGG
jgi:hypothetical protein